MTMLKPLTMCITTNCGKFFKRWEYQITLPASWDKKQQLEPDMEQWTGSELGKEYIKAVYCHPAYLTYMQHTSWEMPSWMTHKLELRFPGEISITSDMQMIPPLWQKVKSESEVAQFCPTLSDPIDCSLPGSSVHGIFQARVLEWRAIAFSDRGAYIFSNRRLYILWICPVT